MQTRKTISEKVHLSCVTITEEVKQIHERTFIRFHDGSELQEDYPAVENKIHAVHKNGMHRAYVLRIRFLPGTATPFSAYIDQCWRAGDYIAIVDNWAIDSDERPTIANFVKQCATIEGSVFISGSSIFPTLSEAAQALARVVEAKLDDMQELPLKVQEKPKIQGR